MHFVRSQTILPVIWIDIDNLLKYGTNWNFNQLMALKYSFRTDWAAFNKIFVHAMFHMHADTATYIPWDSVRTVPNDTPEDTVL